MIKYVLVCILSFSFNALASNSSDLLVKLKPGVTVDHFLKRKTLQNIQSEPLIDGWVQLHIPKTRGQALLIKNLQNNPMVAHVQPNYPIKLYNLPGMEKLKKLALAHGIKETSEPTAKPTDNPPIPSAPSNPSPSDDPLYIQQWGMLDNHVKEAWSLANKQQDMVVAVIDTGVDYTHEDLLPNLWRNTREIPDNGIDDDGNGYVDDLVGWDFVSNDNKPYDLAFSGLEIVFGGGNPGHGTHCAGNVAARGQNGQGISGVAPDVKIMAIRFLSEKGSGTTADAVKAVKYAVDNGAKVLSNSWGSEGEEEGDPDNQALKDVIQYAQDRDVLFIAAAGNGHQGVGYDNDTDAMPGVPASYDHENIVSVAALDVDNNLGSFSNWGATSVDIGAPGVKIFSTVPSNVYTDLVVEFLGEKIYWDGTSMATPHVAGAAALYWGSHPNKTFAEVKAAILNSATQIPSLAGKVTSQGKLNVYQLMQAQ